MPFDNTTAAIANGASLSGIVDLQDHELVGIVWPAAWTAAAITLQASVDGVTFNDVCDSAGTELSYPTQTSKHMLLDPSKAPYGLGRYIKVRSGTSGAPVAQAAARLIVLLVQKA